MTSLRNVTQLNQWKNLFSVIEWFKQLQNKQSLTFIVFDIVEFYPNITEPLLKKALEYAKEHGLFLLSQLKQLNLNIGLYRDDGLAVCDLSERQAELTKKKLCKIFKDHGLNITAEANKKDVNFLDVNLNLETEL